MPIKHSNLDYIQPQMLPLGPVSSMSVSPLGLQLLLCFDPGKLPFFHQFNFTYETLTVYFFKIFEVCWGEAFSNYLVSPISRNINWMSFL